MHKALVNMTFADESRRGVMFSHVGSPLYVQALHYTWEDLEFARHRASQLRFERPLARRKEVCLNLDLRQCGLGNGSCGRNQTMVKYRFPAVPERWTLRIEPLK